MKSEQPATNIMKTGNWADAKAFRIACDCQDPSHDVTAWIEIEDDQEFKQVVMTFYVNVTTPFWRTGFNRIREAWNILVHGHSRYEHGFILNERTAENMFGALRNASDQLKKLIDRS